MIGIARKIRCFGVFCCTILLCSPVGSYAQSGVNPDRNKPLEITAQESLEWHRNDLYFQAEKEVRAVQGETTIYCDKLIAKYRDSEKSNIDIYRIEAIGKVRVISAGSKVYGEKAVYNMDKGLVEMIGKNLRLISEDQNIKARDKFLYWVAEGRFEAIGEAVAVREGDKIEADKLTAIFTKGGVGQRALKSLEAVGNVMITTPEEVLTGEHAFYSVKTGIAEMNDNVRIMKGESFLEGARAQVNLNTNISKIFGARTDEAVATDAGDGVEESIVTQEEAETGKGRVRAVFYPKNMDMEQ